MRHRTGWLVAVAIAVVLTVSASGCSAISNEINTQQALENSGYSSVSVRTSNDDVIVTASESTQPDPQADDDGVARVVWNTLHESFDTLDVTVNSAGGPETQSYTFQDMQRQFGIRPPADDRTSVQNAVVDTGLEIVGGIAAFVVVAVIVVIVIVISVRRRRRNSTPQYGGYPGYPPGGPWPPGPHPGQWQQPYPPGPFPQQQQQPQYPPPPPAQPPRLPESHPPE